MVSLSIGAKPCKRTVNLGLTNRARSPVSGCTRTTGCRTGGSASSRALARPVESAVYFAVAEALANAVKHAGARLVQIRMVHSGGMLRAEVTDDGAGGADPAAGTGLLGIERRLGTFDGVLAISSPPGGPTIVVIEVPCELSSPRTYSC